MINISVWMLIFLFLLAEQDMIVSLGQQQ